MLRLYDPRTGKVSDVRPARPGRLVIQVAPTTDLRGQVIADTLRRTAERRRLRVFLFSDLAPADLNIRPGLPGETAAADLGVGDVSSRWPLALGSCGSRVPAPAELAAKGLDPLALRLTILRHSYREPLEPSWDDFERAHADLVHRRDQVAEWARSPGRPMAGGYVTAAEARLCEDLDVAGALRVLADLADDPAVPPGAKFESFVHLDLILALDLVAAVGR
jgi:hypothetical protein